MNESEENLEGPEFIDLQTDEYTALFANSPLYEKITEFKVRPAVVGEKIVTKLSDGTVETENIAEENQLVVTNPGGEEYIISQESAAGFQPTEKPGFYREAGLARIIDNPTGKEVTITPPWGGEEFGDADCKFVATHDPELENGISPDRYILGADEFLQTYRLVEQKLAA